MKSTTKTDKQIILTLDAGGTNFVFSAIQEYREIVKPIHERSFPHDLEKCLGAIISGFEEVNKQLTQKASGISFAFPGPANYPAGIIGDLPNFQAFTDGVALGPILEDKFDLPVFINNDGNLFAFAEAISGYLPMLNERIRIEGGIKQFKNLVGLTLGTGFGCGIVSDKILLNGDNSCDAGIHATLNKFKPEWNAEESVSTRAIQRVYAESAGIAFSSDIMPKDIHAIALGKKEGDQAAAEESFKQFGEALGSSIANISTLVDGIVVLGGGITAAWDQFSPALFKEINRNYKDFSGTESSRLSVNVYNLEEETSFKKFALGRIRELEVRGRQKKVQYDADQRIGVGISRLGASKAIALGAYAFAVEALK